jgi:uncharacterized protein
MRIVLDTNIYIAAVLYNGLARTIVDFITENSYIIQITSKQILEELSQKLSVKFGWPPERINLYLTRIKAMSEIVEPEVKLVVVKRDPEDNKILECALVGKADIIVTLDQDLLNLKNFEGIAIVHPKTLTWTFPEYFKKD